MFLFEYISFGINPVKSIVLVVNSKTFPPKIESVTHETFSQTRLYISIMDISCSFNTSTLLLRFVHMMPSPELFQIWKEKHLKNTVKIKPDFSLLQRFSTRMAFWIARCSVYFSVWLNEFTCQFQEPCQPCFSFAEALRQHVYITLTFNYLAD